jgi:hypothetical protein
MITNKNKKLSFKIKHMKILSMGIFIKAYFIKEMSIIEHLIK